MVQLTDRPHFSPSTSQTSSDAVADDDSPPSKSPLSDGATPPSSTSSPALPETPPSPVESEDSELHARRRAAKFGTAPALIELPKRVDDGDDVAAQEAAVRAHLRKKRRRRSLFLSLRLSYPSLSKASAAQAAAVPPALPSSGVPLPPPAPGMEPVGSSPLSPTHQQPVLRRPRRRSTLTAATDIPWTPPSPLQTTDEHHSKVSVKVRRALSLLAHGDGHHHRQHSATDPAQRQGSVDGLSRRESKRREKAEVGSAGGGVLLREVFVDSPRDEYFGRRESILRNLRALSTHSGGPGSSRAGASSLRRGAPAGTIGEEPELEGRLDRFDSRLTARSIAPSVGSSAGGGGDGGGGAGEQGWLPRINTPVGEASHRWRGKTNPFAEAVPPSAMGSPRPSLSASPRPSFLSSSFGPDDRPLAGSMTPVTSRNGGGFAPDVLPPPPRLAMTTLSPLQGQQFRQGHSGSPPPPSHARPVSPHPSIHSTGRMSPTGRRSPNGHDLLPPIHLSAPTPTKALTPASTASGLPAEPEWAAVHSSPESPYNLNLTGGLLSGGPGGRAMSPSMSFESLFTPPTQTQPLPSAPRSQHAESSTAAARRRMLSALDTTLPGQQRQLLLPNNGGGFEMSRMGSSTLGSEGSALDLGELAVGAPTKSDARPASARASSRRESIARRADTMCLGQESGEVVWERLWENQRGILFFGNPRFSARMLLPNEPANFTRPGLTKDGCKTPYNLRNFQLPDGAWEWASEWMVNMRHNGETDEKGWEYNSWFKVMGWHAVLPWHGYQGWVRRREWIRLRVLKPLGECPTEAQSEHALSRSHTPLSPVMSVGRQPSDFSPVSPVFLEAATLQRWHYEPLLLDEALGLLGAFRWDAERLRLWRTWLEESDGGILGLRALVEDHFAALVGAFTSPVSRLRLQDLIKEVHPDWRWCAPSW